MTKDSSDPLWVSTLRTGSHGSSAGQTMLPCLTVLVHPDVTRVGERAMLRGLLIGQSVGVSRTQPTFGKPGGEPTGPLADPHLSREPFRLKVAANSGGMRLLTNGVRVRADGHVVDRELDIAAHDLERGALLELPGNVVLLLHHHTGRKPTAMDGMLGQSDVIEDVRRELLRVADLGTPVLVRGETGTGKERAAQAIHAGSPRRGGEYVAVNMATVPESVALSTLFGHVKGAFTGAHQRHRGLFERASGGTLLLDEIGETPESVQPMLLRAVETGRILPLGDEHERAVDVRFIAATDSDLERELAGRSFSAALLHRLAGYEIHMPPLRTRSEDIAILLFHFMQAELAGIAESARLAELMSVVVASGLLTRLMRHPLPGNVRQLHNVARHLVISNRGHEHASVTAAVERQMTKDDPVEPVMLQATAPAEARPATPSARPAEITDGELIAALRSHGWSPNRAAASLGVPTGTLHDLMRRSGKVRRAADVSNAELSSTLAACDGDTHAAADKLCVSERALRIALRQRGLAEPD
jgi:two-component system nitrogen regulation response regulator GlnG